MTNETKRMIFSGIFGFVLATLIFVPLLIVKSPGGNTSAVSEMSSESSIKSSERIYNKYTFKHEKTGETYELGEIIDNGIHEFRISTNTYQEIYVGNISRFKFQDVNFDGYTDIVTESGGGMNDPQKIYL